MAKLKDITGQRFGKLVVLERDYSRKNTDRTYWICQCDCGNTTSAVAQNLRRGLTKSCGCHERKPYEEKPHYKNEIPKLYGVWKAMRQRCSAEYSKSYNNYGKRQITVCDEWNNSYESFYKWALANGYKEGLTIDRIDNEGNYEPSNCRWTTSKTQARNRRSTVYLDYNGTQIPLIELCEKYGEPYEKMKNRTHSLEKRGIKPTFDNVFFYEDQRYKRNR